MSSFKRQQVDLDEMRALCIDLGYDLNDVRYGTVKVLWNVVTLETYDRDADGELIPHGRNGIRTTRHIHWLPRDVER